MKSLWDRVDFVFQKNDHTAAELLLYPHGFQQYTPTPDNGIFEALAGNDDDSAIADKTWDADSETWEITDSPLDEDTSRNRFDPDLGAELYITNGDLLDDAYTRTASSASRPRAREPAADNVSGFEFQDDEDDIEAEFQRHLLFSLDLARSADDPANPVSHLGNDGRGLLRRRLRRLLRRSAARRGRPPSGRSATCKLRYRINGGRVQQAPTKEAPGRRAVQQRAGRLLPPPARRGEGHRAG